MIARGTMLEVMFYAAGLGGALWLAVAAVDISVAIIRREWRFRVRSALILMAVLSLIMGVIATLLRK